MKRTLIFSLFFFAITQILFSKNTSPFQKELIQKSVFHWQGNEEIKKTPHYLDSLTGKKPSVSKSFTKEFSIYFRVRPDNIKDAHFLIIVPKNGKELLFTRITVQP